MPLDVRMRAVAAVVLHTPFGKPDRAHIRYMGKTLPSNPTAAVADAVRAVMGAKVATVFTKQAMALAKTIASRG